MSIKSNRDGRLMSTAIVVLTICFYVSEGLECTFHFFFFKRYNGIAHVEIAEVFDS